MVASIEINHTEVRKRASILRVLHLLEMILTFEEENLAVDSFKLLGDVAET
jgi:hypothetical protein